MMPFSSASLLLALPMALNALSSMTTKSPSPPPKAA
jgi:hypothetical protein